MTKPLTDAQKKANAKAKSKAKAKKATGLNNVTSGIPGKVKGFSM